MNTSDVVVITGASAGVGRATASAFAKQGARLGLLARGQEGLDTTCQEVRALGGEALAIPTDVADADAVEAATARVERELGPIRVWVNNAMATVFAPHSGDLSGRIQTGHRGDLSRRSVRDDGRSQAHAAP